MIRFKTAAVVALALIMFVGSTAFALSFFQKNNAVYPVYAQASVSGDAPEIIAQASITPETAKQPKRIIVMIDAGHGGIDPGAHYNGTYEKELTLNIAEEIRRIERQDSISPVEIALTRDFDKSMPLEERARLANQDAAFFLSVHCNANADTARPNGSVTLFSAREYDGSPISGQEIAETVQRHLVNTTNCVDLGIQENDNLFLLNHTTAPTVIIEVGFMSNPRELDLLRNKSYQALIAHGLYNAVLELAARFERID